MYTLTLTATGHSTDDLTAWLDQVRAGLESDIDTDAARTADHGEVTYLRRGTASAAPRYILMQPEWGVLITPPTEAHAAVWSFEVPTEPPHAMPRAVADAVARCWQPRAGVTVIPAPDGDPS